MATIRAMTKTGDVKLIWDKNKSDEVEAAKALFDKMIKKPGYKAYAVAKEGEKGSIIAKFDPDAEKIIMAPPLQGG